ncbi:hypothetical protein [Mariniflexile maritimum]|uniref:hypothetical protein n=1 Tax=Mariniflexile maritimum TaxID=2682493 RepID=UPI0012F6E3E0|nr:hypothetical protein [Mariniflexile maritimum]
MNKVPLNISISQDLITSIFSDLIGTSISLAGFVLASLTIIVTFKDNITQKANANLSNVGEGNDNKNSSGIELLFSSKHYGRIVGVFTWAVFIYLLLFLVLSFLKLFIGKIDETFFVYLCIVPIVLITLTIFRSVLVLYRIIKLQLAR